MKNASPITIRQEAAKLVRDFLTRTDDPVFRNLSGEPTPWDINCGLCEDFAQELADRLTVAPGDNLEVIWLHETLWHDDDGPIAFDHEILERFGIELPVGQPEAKIFEVFSEMSHAVLLYQSPRYGTHFFDAQAPQGVRSYFDLPLVQDGLGVLADERVSRLIEQGVGADATSLEAAMADYFRQQESLRKAEFWDDHPVPKKENPLMSP